MVQFLRQRLKLKTRFCVNIYWETNLNLIPVREVGHILLNSRMIALNSVCIQAPWEETDYQLFIHWFNFPPTILGGGNLPGGSLDQLTQTDLNSCLCKLCSSKWISEAMWTETLNKLKLLWGIHEWHMWKMLYVFIGYKVKPLPTCHIL